MRLLTHLHTPLNLFNNAPEESKSGGTRFVLPTYLHFGSFLGFERLWAGTLTVFGPGLPLVRTGRHLVLVAIIDIPHK